MESLKKNATWVGGAVLVVVACSALLGAVDQSKGSREEELAALSLHSATAHAGKGATKSKSGQKLYDVPSFTEERTRMSFPSAETDWLDRAAAGQIGDDEKSDEDMGNLTAIINEWRERARNETRAAREEAKRKALESYVDYNVSKGRAIHKIFGKEEGVARLEQERKGRSLQVAPGALDLLVKGVQKLFGGEMVEQKQDGIVWPGAVKVKEEEKRGGGEEENGRQAGGQELNSKTKFVWPDKKIAEKRLVNSLVWPRRKEGKENFAKEDWSWPDRDSLKSGWLWPQSRRAATRSSPNQRSAAAAPVHDHQQQAGKTVSPLAWPSSSGPSRATKAETTPHSSSFASRLSPPLVTRSEHSTRVRGFGSSLTWPARMETTGPAGAGAGAGARAETQNRIVSSSPLVVEARPYVAASSARVTQLASGTRAAGTQLKEEGAKEEERGVSRPLVSEKEQRVSLKSRQERLALALAKEVLSSAKSLKSPESDRRP
mmetsp:Transcript_22482/g.73774  ORF Transcript_22482/g.73774 Transcript_22482/m.73774 type:complete len:489 (-) Transcript_22482:154-1620(-)